MENLYSDTPLSIHEWMMYMPPHIASEITKVIYEGIFNIDREYFSISEMISTGFSWARSPQGGYYWANLESEISRRSPIQIGKKVSIIEEDGEY